MQKINDLGVAAYMSHGRPTTNGTSDPFGEKPGRSRGAPTLASLSLRPASSGRRPRTPRRFPADPHRSMPPLMQAGLVAIFGAILSWAGGIAVAASIGSTEAGAIVTNVGYVMTALLGLFVAAVPATRQTW